MALCTHIGGRDRGQKHTGMTKITVYTANYARYEELKHIKSLNGWTRIIIRGTYGCNKSIEKIDDYGGDRAVTVSVRACQIMP